MSSDRKDMLFELIYSLSKSEKRHFNIYAKRINYEGNVLFLDLFDYLEKQKHYDAQALLGDLPAINKSQLSNVKRSLYNHILSSLSLLYDHKKPSLKIRAFMNYAELLYAKGLYLQSLKILSRAKKIALKSHEDSLHLDIIIQEQKIQSRHITRSTTSNMKELIRAADEKLNVKVNISLLSNLKLYLQRQFIIHGPEISNDRMQAIQKEFEIKMSGFTLDKLTLFEKVYYYQCCYWINYIQQEYEQCYQFTKQWVKLFLQHPSMKEKDFDLYLICKHHYLNMLVFTKRYKRLAEQQNLSRKYAEDTSLNTNSFLLANLFYYLMEFDIYISNAESKGVYPLIKKVNKFLQLYGKHLDSYKIHTLHYKIACIYMSSHAYEKAIDPLNEIINSKNPLRQEIVCYARILLIICFIELEDNDMALYFTSQTKRYINVSNQSNSYMAATIVFFQKLLTADIFAQKSMYSAFSKQLNNMDSHSGKKRAEIFIDLSRWLANKER